MKYYSPSPPGGVFYGNMKKCFKNFHTNTIILVPRETQGACSFHFPHEKEEEQYNIFVSGTSAGVRSGMI